MTKKVLSLEGKKSRIYLSALIGSIFALAMPIVHLPNWVHYFLKAILGILMVLIAFSEKGLKRNMLSIFVFISLTALMGGISFLVIYLITGSFTQSVSSLPFPISIFYLSLFLYVVLFSKALVIIKKRLKKNSFVFNVKITNGEKKIKAKAFLDSGNVLVDPETKKPIMLIGWKSFSRLVSVPIEKVIQKNVTNFDISTSRYISINTISGTNSILVFESDVLEIEIDNRKREIEKPLCGLSLSKFEKNFDCDILLGPNFF